MLLSASSDLSADISASLKAGVSHNKILLAQQHPKYPGNMSFEPLVEKLRQPFLTEYAEWMSRYLTLNELFLLEPFLDVVAMDGWDVHAGPSTAKLLDDYERWNSPLKIDGFELKLRDGTVGDLYDYQTFTLNRALERSVARSRSARFFFFGWGTGTGKSMISAAGAQEMYNRGQVDLVLAFTLRKLKLNLAEFFNRNSSLKAVVNDNRIPATRKSRYFDPTVDVFVMNYDKAHFDFDALKQRVKGQRVLFILDEVQKITTSDEKTRARQGLDGLVRGSESTVWPMSASVVQETPFNYRDVFSMSGGSGVHPLGTKTDFEDRYVTSKNTEMLKGRSGGWFSHTFYDWNHARLHEVRHRVSAAAQSVRKTDPAVRDLFKGLQTLEEPVQMSREDRLLYEAITDEARAAQARGESLAPYYRLQRYVCNNPEALLHTRDEFGMELAQKYPKLCISANSSKLEMVLDKIEAIRDSGDKVVLFTAWTNLSLFLISKALDRRKIKFVQHYGTGMSDAQAKAAETSWKENHDITVFASSDAGAYGLNLQEARYVINYEVPYSYDLLMQRSERINRADSWLDGLTNYCYVTADTVEERVWRINNERRKLAAATTGTTETLTYGAEEDPKTLAYLVLGED